MKGKDAGLSFMTFKSCACDSFSREWHVLSELLVHSSKTQNLISNFLRLIFLLIKAEQGASMPTRFFCFTFYCSVENIREILKSVDQIVYARLILFFTYQGSWSPDVVDLYHWTVFSGHWHVFQGNIVGGACVMSSLPFFFLPVLSFKVSYYTFKNVKI